jgi:pyridoxamine 5'-phosphate oxidase
MATSADRSGPLRKADVATDPIVQFALWFDEAKSAMTMPEAVALATVDAECRPSARMVLLKGWDNRGFVFHTNYESRKGLELATNHRGALLFYWEPPGRQVRIEGSVERVSPEESDTYFGTRPRGGQIGAHASRQSQPIGNREELDRRTRELTTRFDGRVVPRPPWWGGFRLVPDSFEFWQNRDDRLHDRLRYDREDEKWRIERLQP